MRVCVGMLLMLQQTIYNSSLVFTSSQAEPKVQPEVRDYRLGSFVVIDTALTLHVDFKISRNKSEFFTAPYGLPSSQFLLSSFLVSVSLAPTGNATSGSSNV